jgi:hypothetical protein
MARNSGTLGPAVLTPPHEQGANVEMVGDSHDNLTQQTKESPTFAGEFYNSAMYRAFEAPVLGLTQLIDKTGTNLSANVSSAFDTIGVSAPKQESLSTGAWLGRTIGGAVGMMAPVGLLGMGSRGLLSSMAPSLLTERTAIGLSLSESTLTGGVFGTLLTPTDGKDLLTERMIGGAGMATSFGLLSGTGLAMSKFGMTETAARWGMRDVLQNPISAGVFSGVPAGLINAETNAVQKGDWIFSKEELGTQMLQMSIVGGVFGARTQLFGAKPAEAPVRPQTQSRTPAEAPVLVPALAVADEGPVPGDARSGLWQPEMRPEWEMPPAAVASFRNRVTEMLDRRQQQHDLPTLAGQLEQLQDSVRDKQLQLTGHAVGIGIAPEGLKPHDVLNYYKMKQLFGDNEQAREVNEQLRKLETQRLDLSTRISDELERRTRELTKIINSAAPSLFPRSALPEYKVGVHDETSYGIYQGDGGITLSRQFMMTAAPKRIANTLAHEAKHGEQEALLTRKYIDEVIGDKYPPTDEDLKKVAQRYEEKVGAGGPSINTINEIFQYRDGEFLKPEELDRANKLEQSLSDLVRHPSHVAYLNERADAITDALERMEEDPEMAMDSVLSSAAGDANGLRWWFGDNVHPAIADLASKYEGREAIYTPDQQRMTNLTPFVDLFRYELTRAKQETEEALKKDHNVYRDRYHEKEAYAISAQVNGGPLDWRTPEQRMLDDIRHLLPGAD